MFLLSIPVVSRLNAKRKMGFCNCRLDLKLLIKDDNKRKENLVFDYLLLGIATFTLIGESRCVLLIFSSSRTNKLHVFEAVKLNPRHLTRIQMQQFYFLLVVGKFWFRFRSKFAFYPKRKFRLSFMPKIKMIKQILSQFEDKQNEKMFKKCTQVFKSRNQQNSLCLGM